jgi:Zn finger protein HypA/HybF involved in hydrogenase expression
MPTKIVCEDCGAQFDDRMALEDIVVNSAVQKTRKICPECQSTSGTFSTIEVDE